MAEQLDMHEAGADMLASATDEDKKGTEPAVTASTEEENMEGEEDWVAALTRNKDAKRAAEEGLLSSLVRGMRHLESELKTERKARQLMEARIRARNVEDDAQLAILTKTVDTLLFNLQGYESAAIAREDDNEAERANQAKRRSLEKKRLLQMKQELEQKEQMLAENAETIKTMTDKNTAQFQRDEHKKYTQEKRRKEEADAAAAKAATEAAAAADGQAAALPAAKATPEAAAQADADADAPPDEDEETRAARIQAQKVTELQSQKLQKERERRKSMSQLKEANEHYSAAIIQSAFRRYLRMKIWKSALDFGRQRVKDGNAISVRIAKLEKMCIDLNAYRQRQEEELEEAARLAEEMKRQGVLGSPELQAVIERMRNNIDLKADKEETLHIAEAVKLSVNQVAEVKTDQAELRDEFLRAQQDAAAEGLKNVQLELTATKESLDNALTQIKAASESATASNAVQVNALREDLLELKRDHTSLLSVATSKDPNAIDADGLSEAMSSIEDKIEAIRIAKLDDEDLKEKMQPLMLQLKDVSKSVGTLQGLNKKVAETAKINRQKVSHESKKTSELADSLAKLKRATESLAASGGGGGGSNLSEEEEKELHDMLMADIQSRMAAVQEGNHEERNKLKQMLRTLDGKVRNTKMGINVDLEKLKAELGHKVSEEEMRDLQERLASEMGPTSALTRELKGQMTNLTTKHDVERMIKVLQEKQEELSAIGVKCLVCSQNVPGGMSKPSPWAHKRLPRAESQARSLEDLRSKTFDARVAHKLSDLMAHPLRRAGALRPVKGKWQNGWGGRVQGSPLPKDGYGPLGWGRVESSVALVDRMMTSPKKEYSSSTGRAVRKKQKIKLNPRSAMQDGGASFPRVKGSSGPESALEFGLTVKKRQHKIGAPVTRY
jgi:hypothetical protein